MRPLADLGQNGPDEGVTEAVNLLEGLLPIFGSLLFQEVRSVHLQIYRVTIYFGDRAIKNL